MRKEGYGLRTMYVYPRVGTCFLFVCLVCACVCVYMFVILLNCLPCCIETGLLLNLGLMGSSCLLASLSQVPPALELWVYTTTPGLLFYLIISLGWYFLNICLHFENFICVIFTLFPRCFLSIPAPSVFYAPVPSQIRLSQLPWTCLVSWEVYILSENITSGIFSRSFWIS